MKLKTLIAPCIILVIMGGCAGMSDASKAKLDALEKQNVELVGKVAEVYAKIQTGALTINDGKAIALELQTALTKNISEIQDVKASENLSKTATVGAVGGLLLRSGLHLVASGGIPLGPLAPFQPLLALFLGGSASKRKEDKKPE